MAQVILYGPGGSGVGLPLKVGRLLDNGPLCVAQTAATAVSNRFQLQPFIPPRSFTADQIGAAVTTQAIGVTVRAAVFDSNDDGTPKDRVAISGDLSTGSTGYVSDTIDFDFEAGQLYWLAVHAGGTPGLRALNVNGSLSLGLAAGTDTTSATAIYTSTSYGAGTPTTFDFSSATFLTTSPFSVRLRVGAVL